MPINGKWDNANAFLYPALFIIYYRLLFNSQSKQFIRHVYKRMELASPRPHGSISGILTHMMHISFHRFLNREERADKYKVTSSVQWYVQIIDKITPNEYSIKPTILHMGVRCKCR
jgi:hypothetical protein